MLTTISAGGKGTKRDQQSGPLSSFEVGRQWWKRDQIAIAPDSRTIAENLVVVRDEAQGGQTGERTRASRRARWVWCGRYSDDVLLTLISEILCRSLKADYWAFRLSCVWKYDLEAYPPDRNTPSISAPIFFKEKFATSSNFFCRVYLINVAYDIELVSLRRSCYKHLCWKLIETTI